ncbi:MAG: helix-turn-helix domain-containing protein [Nitrospirota bacterium]
MKLVSAKEIIELLGIKKSTVYLWAETGVIPFYKLNGAIRFSVEEVLEWIKSCRRAPVKI